MTFQRPLQLAYLRLRGSHIPHGVVLGDWQLSWNLEPHDGGCSGAARWRQSEILDWQFDVR